jgi:hypothetical protein
MSLKLHERLTGLLSFAEDLGVYLLLMDDRSYRILHTAENLHPKRGTLQHVEGKRVAHNILAVERIEKA